MAWAAAVAGGCGGIRPPLPDQKLVVKVDGEVFESDRGYRFASLPNRASNVVWLDVRYPVGSADDPPGKAGLAHLVEHMLFQVEIDRGGRRTSIGAELGRVALYANAETAADYTVYQTMVAPEHLDAVLGLEIDRLSVGCAGLTPEGFAREREVVVNEMRARQGADGSVLQQLVHDAVYPAGHPYRTVASAASVARLELIDVCTFLDTAYRRGPALVIASGEVDRASLIRAAAPHLRRAPRRTSAAPARAGQFPPITGRLYQPGPVDETVVIGLWPLPPSNTEDYRLVELAYPAIASELQAHAYTYGWGHDVGIRLLGGVHAPVLQVSVRLWKRGSSGDAIDALAKSAEGATRMWRYADEDRDSIRWRMKWEPYAAGLLMGWESLERRTESFGEFLQFESGTDYLVARVRELATVRPSYARELASRWLAPSRARILVIEPNGLSSGRGDMTYAGGAEAHAVPIDPSGADRPIAVPGLRPRVEVERYRLANGLTVLMWPHGTEPLVRGWLVVDSGWAHEPAGADGLAASVGLATSADHLETSRTALSMRLDWVIAGLAAELRYASGGYSDEGRDEVRRELRQPRSREWRTFAHEMDEALYGPGHPYARGGLTEQSLGRVRHDRATGWARDHLVPRNATLILVGKFDPKLARRHIAFQLDHLGGGTDSPDIDVPARTRQSWIGGTAGKPSPTLAIEVGFVAGNGIDSDHAKRLVLEAVLGSRLGELRQKRALAYGFSARYTPRRSGGLWTLSGEVDATRAAEAGAAIAQILGELRRDPASSRAAFVYARRKVLQQLATSAGSTGEIMGDLIRRTRFDLGDERDEELLAEVAALTLPEFFHFVRRELDAEGQVFGAFGNRDAVDAALDASRAATRH